MGYPPEHAPLLLHPRFRLLGLLPRPRLLFQLPLPSQQALECAQRRRVRLLVQRFFQRHALGREDVQCPPQRQWDVEYALRLVRIVQSAISREVAQIDEGVDQVGQVEHVVRLVEQWGEGKRRSLTTRGEGGGVVRFRVVEVEGSESEGTGPAVERRSRFRWSFSSSSSVVAVVRLPRARDGGRPGGLVRGALDGRGEGDLQRGERGNAGSFFLGFFLRSFLGSVLGLVFGFILGSSLELLRSFVAFVRSTGGRLLRQLVARGPERGLGGLLQGGERPQHDGFVKCSW
mmetsp:Transcript_10898/g.23625  ORF Transcript_10898/g.23625 Transcript_10898/m.23625 type:complete len:288 (+) Transcript_10898:1234-2097(+)